MRGSEGAWPRFAIKKIAEEAEIGDAQATREDTMKEAGVKNPDGNGKRWSVGNRMGASDRRQQNEHFGPFCRFGPLRPSQERIAIEGEEDRSGPKVGADHDAGLATHSSIRRPMTPATATSPPRSERRVGRSCSKTYARGTMTRGVQATTGKTSPLGVVASAH